MKISLRGTTAALTRAAVLTVALIVTTVSAGQAASAAPSAAVAATASSHRAAPPAIGNVSSPAATSPSFRTSAAAESYWTAKRMATAIAPPVTTVSRSPVIGSVAPEPPVVVGQLTTIPATPGTLPATKSERLKAKVTRPYTNRPDRLNGKVFFSEGGVDYVCSGTVVNSTNKDMIDTAGHCVSDGAGSFVSNWVFVPGYASDPNKGNLGMYPFGIWTARELTTTTQWHYYANIKQDLGYGIVAPLGNRHIADYLGGQGVLFNSPRNQVYSAFGYPQAHPYNGRDQRVAVSRWLSNDSLLGNTPGPETMQISSDLTGGASGGGWVVGISSSTGLGQVAGHNSYRYVGGSHTNARRMYSPYYGTEAQALYIYTQLL